jgi:hypothetical protein
MEATEPPGSARALQVREMSPKRSRWCAIPHAPPHRAKSARWGSRPFAPRISGYRRPHSERMGHPVSVGNSALSGHPAKDAARSGLCDEALQGWLANGSSKRSRGRAIPQTLHPMGAKTARWGPRPFASRGSGYRRSCRERMGHPLRRWSQLLFPSRIFPSRT